MPSYDGLHEFRLKYTVSINGLELTHHQTFDVTLDSIYEPGTPFSEILVSDRAAASSSATTFINSYLALLGDFYAVATNFVSVELWDIPEGTEDAVFISALSLGDAGESASPNVAAQQTIMTFRTQAGGIMKLYLMESVTTTYAKLAYPTGNAPIDALMNFIIDPTRPFVGRDNTPPIVSLNWSPGQNEAVWRKRFRP